MLTSRERVFFGLFRSRKQPYQGNRRSLRPRIDGMEERLLMTSLPKGFSQVSVARKLTEPSGMVATPDGRLFVLQQTGQVLVIKDGKLLPSPLLTVDTKADGERGLDGITLDPNFATNHNIYVYYNIPGAPAHNRLSRFTISGDLAIPGSEVPILDLPGLGTTGHNGGSLQFGADGKLYVSVGDNEVSTNAQSLETPFGKILRINSDGTIPTDNPFYQQTTGINRAIWALGLRNPYSTAVQPGTGKYYINDVGLDTWEKIDPGVAGANYGWPITENAKGDSRFQNPLYVYNHGRNDQNGAAITGGVFYNPVRSQYPNPYIGRYFFLDIKGYIKTYNPRNGAVALFANNLPTVTDSLAIDPNGSLYVLSRGKGPNSGTLLKIQFRRR